MRDYEREARYPNGIMGQGYPVYQGQGYQDSEWNMRRDEPSWGGMRSYQDERVRGGQGMYGQSYEPERYGQERYGQERYGQERYGQERYGQRMIDRGWDRDRDRYGYEPQSLYRGFEDRDRSGWDRFKGEMQNAWDRLRGEPERDVRMYGRSEDWRGRYEPSFWDRTKREAREGWDKVKESFAGKGPKGYTRSDDRIREDVCDRLEASHDIDASDIEVSVSGGEVTLSGAVTERRLKRLAEDIVDDVPGVREVHNQLRTSRMMQGTQTDTSRSGQNVNMGSGITGRTNVTR
jgi:osmotically-inducible protein OsmY